MSHREQQAFLELVAWANKDLVAGAKVVEIGSYDVNGSMRDLFAAAGSYIGVDLTPGPGVDLVGYGHEVDLPDGSVDITLSRDCLEHDPYWEKTFANMLRMTRPGGVVAFTCAGRGFPEYCTQVTEPTDSPGT